MIDGKLLTEKLLRYAKDFLDMEGRDEIYFRNILLREFNEDAPMKEVPDLSYIDQLDVPDTLVEEIENLGVALNKCTEDEKNLYSTYIFGLLSPLPSKFNKRFNELKKESIEKACEYFYSVSVKNNYVQKTAIGRNLKWEFQDGKRYLEITINLSKPEKNNKDIAKLLSMPKTEKYPECLLCKENEGFKGTLTHPARENIRTVSLKLGGEDWFVQYSPYAYYNEHLIAINEKHVPMDINQTTIDKVLDFVDYFPNYMIGSNASLPIIGGSILNHEHFQGGGHLMPMHNAPVRKAYSSKKYKKVKVGRVNWYNTVIRLESKDRKQIADFAKDVVNAWKVFNDEENYIFSETDGIRHSSLSPVARKQGKTYIIDMILRNNITTEEYPDGLFHAHPEYHNIKKEGIGLIEAMGLFILPGRLKKQLSMIADILCGNEPYDENELNKEDNYLFVHREMIKELKEKDYKNKEDALNALTDRINLTCKNILFNTAVFKEDEKGERGFNKFMDSLGVK